MPGSRREYLNAVEEGAQFMFLTNAVSLSGNSGGDVYEARCVRMELGEPDAKGRRKPQPIPGSEFSVPVDVVLIAYGFDPVPIFAAGNSDNINQQMGRVAADEPNDQRGWRVRAESFCAPHLLARMRDATEMPQAFTNTRRHSNLSL
jgi:NADPH-dependent glutamate synthase beta subunit-like oxidoreductase